MREVIRDLDGASPCPRCGRPVRYKGRGRPPVWCSSECRIEASIERKGNRAVGVQPEVVKVIPVRTRQTAWEKERRATLEAELPDQLAVARVASRADLVAALVDRLASEPAADNPIWRRIARSMRATADAFSPASSDDDLLPPDDELPPPHDELPRHRRSAADWTTLLDELAAALGNGQFYNRDLPELFEVLKRVVDRFDRRRAEWGRF